jgi:hypothetical protein
MPEFKQIPIKKDMERMVMNAFHDNVMESDKLPKKYRGSFVAIYRHKVVASNIDGKKIHDCIPENIRNEQELYVGYIPKDGDRCA